MEFEKFKWRERAQQSFNKEEIHFVKNGKKINVYDFIQEGREDTEIYPTLEKYGCIDKMMLNREDVYADYTELQKMRDYRGVKDFENQAKQMFYNLPTEVRKEFDNDINKFTRNADKYIEKLKAEDKAKADALKQAQQAELTIEKPVTKGEVSNG